jgi:Protein of unknown function (DUF1064)
MRRETAAEREAWTAHIEGKQVVRANKYGAEREGKYASKREAKVAAELAAMERCGAIKNLREQVSYTLVPGQGKIRPIRYVADFVYRDENAVLHVCDAKGYAKNPVYRLKKKLMLLLHGISIEEL